MLMFEEMFLVVQDDTDIVVQVEVLSLYSYHLVYPIDTK
jgi:hypothetical protein